jgi:hypothetical protein
LLLLQFPLSKTLTRSRGGAATAGSPPTPPSSPQRGRHRHKHQCPPQQLWRPAVSTALIDHVISGSASPTLRTSLAMTYGGCRGHEQHFPLQKVSFPVRFTPSRSRGSNNGTRADLVSRSRWEKNQRKDSVTNRKRKKEISISGQKRKRIKLKS